MSAFTSANIDKIHVQKKTGRPVQFEITEQTRAAIQAWLADSGYGAITYPLRHSEIRKEGASAIRGLLP